MSTALLAPHRSLGRAAVLALLLGAAALPVPAQQPSAAQAGAIRQACRGDYQARCASVPTGGSAALACLQQNAASLSPPCQQALRAASSGAAPQAANAGATPAATATPRAAPGNATATAPADTWPHTVSAEGGSALVYQPQVISWPDRQTLNTRIAMQLTPAGDKAAVLGTVEASFSTSTDLASRQVSLSNGKLLSSRFPAADTAQAQRFDERIRAALAAMPAKRVPLDMLLLSLRGSSETPPAVTLQHPPPQIFVSQRAASLLVFDGEPVLAPVAGTPLSVAVNTNWDVFVDGSSGKTWYWLNNGAWLRAADFKGPWAPAGALPAAFNSLPGDRNFADVRKSVPGRSMSATDMPQVFVSTTPAEIIVIEGAPQYSAIAGTQLQYVANTASPVFRHNGNGLTYYLVSGRWFSALALQGPWAFATADLPADFARIPPNSPRGYVLASVPGTVQAQEALIHAQIPQQATLDKASAKLEVVYAGAPKFETIPGTSMAYAVNTSFNVVRVDSGYWACYQGAWFAAPSPAGTWTLAASVPEIIYTIPPASPLYPCTYVRVYAATPTSVTYGYTAGYTMGFITAGVIVYGTGYYYPPYLYPAPIPIYYPYPVTYGAATYYNPATGAWARGGSVYGPYGGAGAFSAYNPSTGSYAHGSGVYGPDGAAGNASWYNARTGVSGSTQQNANAYSRWGSSTISGPNQTVHTQSQSDSRGSAGSFSSSTGAEGAGARGAGGNSAGAVKTADGNVYAGADGNVYKKTDDGWQKYDNGSWNQVQKPQAPAARNSGGTPPQRAPTEGNLSGAAAGQGEGRFQGSGQGAQLEQDHQARFGGFQRQQQYGAAREGGFGGGRFRR